MVQVNGYTIEPGADFSDAFLTDAVLSGAKIDTDDWELLSADQQAVVIQNQILTGDVLFVRHSVLLYQAVI
mgnify:CR=1 FL=1|jgi:uncharacterized protein YjbI with pentapeptide repeats